MNLMINQVLTMSSREIATLCDKEHRNVLADIRTMCEQPNRCANFSAHLFGQHEPTMI